VEWHDIVNYALLGSFLLPFFHTVNIKRSMLLIIMAAVFSIETCLFLLFPRSLCWEVDLIVFMNFTHLVLFLNDSRPILNCI